MAALSVEGLDIGRLEQPAGDLDVALELGGKLFRRIADQFEAVRGAFGAQLRGCDGPGHRRIQASDDLSRQTGRPEQPAPGRRRLELRNDLGHRRYVRQYLQALV